MHGVHESAVRFRLARPRKNTSLLVFFRALRPTEPPERRRSGAGPISRPVGVWGVKCLVALRHVLRGGATLYTTFRFSNNYGGSFTSRKEQPVGQTLPLRVFAAAATGTAVTAALLAIYQLALGSVPPLTALPVAEGWTVNLPVAVSPWWDVPAAAFWSAAAHLVVAFVLGKAFLFEPLDVRYALGFTFFWVSIAAGGALAAEGIAGVTLVGAAFGAFVGCLSAKTLLWRLQRRFRLGVILYAGLTVSVLAAPGIALVAGSFTVGCAFSLIGAVGFVASATLAQELSVWVRSR